MEAGRVSVLIPSRNERFLAPTVRDVLAKAAGDVEVIVVLEGYWPDPPLPSDPRLKLLHFGVARGMRAALNAAVQSSTGQYLLKVDAHVMVADGYDAALRRDYAEDNWVLIPRRLALDPEAWSIDKSNKKYPVDYHYLSNPFATPGDSTPGLHGSEWRQRRDARQHIEVDDELSSQGSCWFMARAHWDRVIRHLDAEHYGSFWHEFQEIGLRTWLSGGAVKVTKRTTYAHLYKGKKWGRGFSLANSNHERGSAFCTWFWMTDQPFPERARSMRWLIEKFAPVPTWPADLDQVFDRARRELSNPYQDSAFNWSTHIATTRSNPVASGVGAMAQKLVIVSAKYGVGLKDGEFVDVTEKVRSLVTDSGLRLVVTNEALGVGPVFKGKRKRLWVEHVVGDKVERDDAIERRTLSLG